MKREGKVWIRVFPDKPITQKALGVRMGKGKGTVEYWVAPIQPGRVLSKSVALVKKLLVRLSVLLQQNYL